MGLENRRSDLERLENSVEKNFSIRRFHHVKKILDIVLPFALMLVFFTIVFGFVFRIGPGMQLWIDRLNWTLMAYFMVRLVVIYRISRNTRTFLHKHWLDLLLVVPVFAALRGAKVARFLPFFEHSTLAGSPAAIGATDEAAKMTRITRILRRSL